MIVFSFFLRKVGGIYFLTFSYKLALAKELSKMLCVDLNLGKKLKFAEVESCKAK